jgi:gamma-glutamyltranspeptidase/glutathione hydrolase
MTQIDDGSWSLTAAEAARSRQRAEAFGTRGMVCSAHPLAAAVGISILQRGGNAFDAAIAVAAAEGVVLPMKCGVGGDAFVIAHSASRNETLAFNGSGVAAAGATRAYYAERGYDRMPLDGVHAASVPGAVDVYETIWKRYGTLPWADLWQPAIELATAGVAITDYVSARYEERADRLARFEWSKKQFLPDGRAPRPGERWCAPDLARTLKAIAEGGAQTFYRGDLAERMVAALKAEGGLFTREDFASQRTVAYAPLATDYRGHTVLETAPPSQGFLVLEQLNILEGYDLARLELFGAERIHLLTEAKKLAFADRNRHAGDPAFVRWPVERFISKAHADARRKEIDPQRARWPLGADVPEHDGDTSYFAVADAQGNALSFIHSLSNSFGCCLVAGDTGVTFNNRAGRGFSLDPAHPNVIAPGRRTMHTLNAYMLFRDGKPWLVGGTPGGDQQAQWNPQTITAFVDHGMPLQELVDAPRWYSFPGTDPANLGREPVLKLDARIPEDVRAQLAAKGHRIEVLAPFAGGGAIQLIQFDHAQGVLRGASDSRPGGVALGW